MTFIIVILSVVFGVALGIALMVWALSGVGPKF